jgi:hypothetical protein
LSRISLGLVALVAALLLAIPAFARPAAPTPSPAPTAAPVADPAVTKIAVQQFLAWQVGTIDKALYDPRLLANMDDAKIADVSKHIAPLGALISTQFIGPFSGEDFPADAKGYIYQMTCANGKMYEELVLTGTAGGSAAGSKIGYMYFRDKLTTEDVTAPGGAAAPGSPPPPRAKRLAR